MAIKITFLSTLLATLIKVCKVVAVAREPVRRFVPDESKAAYDTALDNIEAACDVIRAINYLDSNSATNPPFGRGH